MADIVEFKPPQDPRDQKAVIPVNLPDIPVMGFGSPEGGLADMDPEVFLNIRDWVRRACEARGARFTGGGYGCGVCDLDIEIEGHHYNITIKPLPDR
jgi:hypothetical protein